MWDSRGGLGWATTWEEGVIDRDRTTDVFESCKELVVKGWQVRGYKGGKARGITNKVEVEAPFGPTGECEGARTHWVIIRRAESESPGRDGGESAEGGVGGDGVVEVWG